MSKTVVHAKRNAFPSIFDYGNCFPLNESIYKLPLGHEMSTWRITFRVDALVGKPYVQNFPLNNSTLNYMMSIYLTHIF